jgi:hypothetical protein
MVGATGSDQTAKARSTAQAFLFNASTNTLSAANVYAGSATPTGTASQPLQVTGGAYVSGNLGVGNTNPQAELHVEQSIDGEIFRLQRSGGSNIPILAFDLSDASNVATIRGTGATGAEIAFNAGSQERVRIKTTGNVGIGTTNPSYKLHVIGDIGGAELINYSDHLYAFGNTGATPSFTLRNGNFVTATLSANITSMTFDLSGCPTTTAAFSFTLVLTNDATPSRTITWPASVKWPNATVPTRTTTANKSDVYTFFTYDAGTTWWGNLSLYNFS